MGKDKRKKQKGIGKLKEKIEKIKDDMVYDYIIIYEKKYKKEPSQEVINKMYEKAQKVVNRNIRRFGFRVAAIVSVIGITGVAFLNEAQDDTKALPEGQKQEQSQEEEKISKEKAFRDSVKELTAEEKFAKEIDELESVQEVDEYLNKIYIQEYAQKTGDTELKASDIQIDESTQNYVYELEDGQIVTHGEFPEETEKKMELDGENFTSTDEELKIYTVKLKESNKIIDAVTKYDFEKVIAGDNYEEMKESESALMDIKGITKTAFRLKELITELEKDPQNEGSKAVCEVVREELAELVVKYNEQKETQIAQQNQTQVQTQVKDDKDVEIGE